MLLCRTPALASLAMTWRASSDIVDFPPFESVKSVECYYPPADELEPLLKLFPSLAQLHLRVVRQRNVPKPIVFTHLKALTITDEYGMPDIDVFIKSFTLTSLTDFTLITPGSRVRDHHIGGSLVDCLKRSGCSGLRTLCVSSRYTPLRSNSEWISDLIDLSPELRAINLEFRTLENRDAVAGASAMTNTVVYRLCTLLSDSLPSTLPSLSTLTVHIRRFPTDKSWNSVARDMAARFLRMVESRAENSSLLRHVELLITSDLLSEDDSPDESGDSDSELEAFYVDVARRCKSLLVNSGVTFILNMP
ncbi:hypothetical protein PQX77_021081 [Marasmius sp. AFHP31]|nr:hypothetical protein PQX77_021081 [Marasmius sp. AFHP31]